MATYIEDVVGADPIRFYKGGVVDPRLTPWGCHVLAEYASGLRVRDIAEKHGRTKGAIVWALNQNKVKLGAAHLSQAVAIAIARGDLSMPTGADMQVFALSR